MEIITNQVAEIIRDAQLPRSRPFNVRFFINRLADYFTAETACSCDRVELPELNYHFINCPGEGGGFDRDEFLRIAKGE